MVFKQLAGWVRAVRGLTLTTTVPSQALPMVCASPCDDDMVEAEARAIDAMVEAARNDKGQVQCYRCGREMAEGGYGVSLMGRGASCLDVPDCIADVTRQQETGSARFVNCAYCLRELPITQVKIHPWKGSLSCIDTDGCEEEQRALDDLFRKFKEKYPNGTPPGGGTL